jgi:hypothetical protein
MVTIKALQEITPTNQVEVDLTINLVDNDLIVQSNIPISGVLKVKVSVPLAKNIQALLDQQKTVNAD